jgi:hypothetical protein
LTTAASFVLAGVRTKLPDGAGKDNSTNFAFHGLTVDVRVTDGKLFCQRAADALISGHSR